MQRFLIIILLFVVPSWAGAATSLETARQVAASKFPDWTYGADPAKRQVDCVQFMSAVIEKMLDRPLTKHERNVIHINHGWTAREAQEKVATGSDPKVSGLVYALVELMQVATRVEPADARAGDFVQYWKQDGDGRWSGDASLISEVEAGKALLYGSHQTTDGIAVSNFHLVFTGADQHVFLARLKPDLASGMQTSRDGTLWLPAGNISSKEELANNIVSFSWSLAAQRWGMYDLEAHFMPSASEGEYTLRLGDKSVTGKSIDSPPVKLRVYLPKSGDYPIEMITDPGVDVHALSLTPAPEGRENLGESGGKVILNSRDATVRGQTLRYEPDPKKQCLGFWSNANDRAEWSFTIIRPGVFIVEIDQGCGVGHGGSPAYVACEDQELTFEVEDTGHFQNFKTRKLGRLTLAGDGKHVLQVGAHGKANGAVMDVREIRLLREEEK